MGVFKRTEKILVVADNIDLDFIRRFDCLNQWFSGRPFHLYPVLGDMKYAGVHPGVVCLLP